MFRDFLNDEADNFGDETQENDEGLRPNKTNELLKLEEQVFNKRWGWLMIAKNVSDFTNETLFNIMQTKAIEVLTLAMMVNEQSELAKMKYGKQ